jgi:sortase A
MIFIFMVLGAAVLYAAGVPVADYAISKGNMIVEQGAPVDPDQDNTKLQTLVMNKKSTEDQSEVQVPEPDTQYGTIDCERIALSAPVYYGDSETVLQNGVGQFALSGLPGEGKPILMSAHDSTYFAPLEQVAVGDVITITTNNGEYHYSVGTTRIADEADTTAYDLTQDKEQLILYTCYPFGQLVGKRSERFFVYCDLVTDITTN